MITIRASTPTCVVASRALTGAANVCSQHLSNYDKLSMIMIMITIRASTPTCVVAGRALTGAANVCRLVSTLSNYDQ